MTDPFNAGKWTDIRARTLATPARRARYERTKKQVVTTRRIAPIRTHYLDWERIWTEAGAQRVGNTFTNPVGGHLPWVPSDTGDPWVAQCIGYWRTGYYIAGPVETAYHLPEDETEAMLLRDMLWHKYNADARPDGHTRRPMSVGDVVQLGPELYLVRGDGWSTFAVEATS